MKPLTAHMSISLRCAFHQRRPRDSTAFFFVLGGLVQARPGWHWRHRAGSGETSALTVLARSTLHTRSAVPALAEEPRQAVVSLGEIQISGQQGTNRQHHQRDRSSVIGWLVVVVMVVMPPCASFVAFVRNFARMSVRYRA